MASLINFVLSNERSLPPFWNRPKTKKYQVIQELLSKKKWTIRRRDRSLSAVNGSRECNCPSLLFWTALFISLINSAAGAMANDGRYPCKAERKELMQRWIGLDSMDRSYLVRHDVGPHVFNVPYGYLIGRPTPERVNCTPRGSGIAFAFWMPDLRAPVADMGNSPGFRMQEPGREKPGMDEYIVKVLGSWYVDPKSGGNGSPAVRFPNMLQGLNEIYRTEDKYGLQYIQNGRDDEDSYGSISDSHFNITLSCSRPAKYIINPSCKAYLYFTDIRVESVILFPSDVVPEWNQIKDTVYKMLKQWRAN